MRAVSASFERTTRRRNAGGSRRTRVELSSSSVIETRCHTCGIEHVRIDQWLHAVRITSTRSQAANACSAGHVKVNGERAKPSTTVKVGDHVEARVGQRQRIVDVVTLISKRVGAPIAVTCFDDHSPPPPEPDPFRPLFAVRDRGTGRPTKRDRRKTDRLRGRDR